MPGFRISVELSTSKGSILKKCLIFIDEQWTKVEDLEKHVRNLFDLKDVELFIDDCWVPGDEPICIIQKNDVITAKKLHHSKSSKHCDSDIEDDLVNRKEKRRKEKKDSKPNASEENGEPSTNLEVLKGELLSRVEALDQECMDVTDGAEPKKRKRKRKHKSKLSRTSTLPIIQTEPSASFGSALVEADTSRLPSNSSHIRFDEDTSAALNGGHSLEQPVLEDWQERLLSLANERNRKVFERRDENRASTNAANELAAPPLANGHCANSVSKENGETNTFELSSIPVDKANPGDVIHFKVLVVTDSCPSPSEKILALVEDIDEESLLTLKILKGKAEELFDPSQIVDSEDGYIVVKIPWRLVLEPALVVDDLTLSKYL